VFLKACFQFRVVWPIYDGLHVFHVDKFAVYFGVECCPLGV
jgi:hypothetical protein